MNGLFSVKYEGGKIVENVVVNESEKLSLLNGLSHKDLNELLTAVLNHVFPSHLVKFENFVESDVGLIVKKMEEIQKAKEVHKEPPFEIQQQSHDTMDVIFKRSFDVAGQNSAVLKFLSGIAIESDSGLPTTNKVVSRFLVSSVSFKKDSAQGTSKLVPCPIPPQALRKVVPQCNVVSQAIQSVFGKAGASSPDELEEKVEEAMKNEGFRASAINTFISSAPRVLTPTIEKDQIYLSMNTQFRFNDSKITERSRSRAKYLLQNIGTAKSGIGYYANSHYDGVPVYGLERKYMDWLNDFDYSTKCRVIRVTSTDPVFAHALYNAVSKNSKDYLVVYTGSSPVLFSQHWQKDKIVRPGVVPYPESMFKTAFKDHLTSVYYFDVSNPLGGNRNTNEGYCEKYNAVEHIRQSLECYGGYSFYSDLSALIFPHELADYNRIVKDQVEIDYSRKLYAPSCMVRKGYFMVSSKSLMNAAEVVRNVLNGLLHANTWMYRVNCFNSNCDPGDEFIVACAPAFDWCTGTKNISKDALIFSELEKLSRADPHAYKAYCSLHQKEDEEEERIEQGADVAKLPLDAGAAFDDDDGDGSF